MFIVFANSCGVDKYRKLSKSAYGRFLLGWVAFGRLGDRFQQILVAFIIYQHLTVGY